MKTYRKQDLSQDERGYFRWLGGKRFRLGRDEGRAKLSAARLEVLFKDCGEWDEMALLVASAIAKGEQQITLAPNPAMSGADSYVHWLDRHAVKFGKHIRFVPEQPDRYSQGQGELLAERTEAQRNLDIAYPLPPSVAKDLPHERLHLAIDAYCEVLKARPDPTSWVKVKELQARRLKVHKDIPLSQMTLDTMEQMLSYWTSRPMVRDKNKPNKPIAATTARNQIRELRDFWKWLNRSDQYAWKRPDGHEDLKPRIVRYPTDRQAHVEIFTPDDLTILYRNATPLVKTFMLLGLNCGFSIAEISTLTTDEVRLGQSHPYASRVHVTSNENDSWILRIRNKSGVYGEYKLWQPTVLALQWAERRMRRITPNGKILLPTDKGKAFNALTCSGNKSSRIANLWANLLRTCEKEKPAPTHLPFKHLRKTAGDLIRQVADGEVAGVFLCHGQPVKSDGLSDQYSNRPFAKVFDAIEKVGKLLQPMFDADKKTSFNATI